MQKFGVILKIIVMHFLLVLTTEFVVASFIEAKAMLLFCQIFFIVWGTVLGVGYFVLGYKLDKKLYGHLEVKDKRALLYIRLIYSSGVNNLILSVMFIYSSAGVFGIYSNVKYIDAWSWWAVQTCYRLGEVLSGILVFTVSANRKRIKRGADHTLEGDGLEDDSAQPGTKPFTPREKYRISSVLHDIASMRFLTMAGDQWTTMLEDLQETKHEVAMYYAREQMDAQTHTHTHAPDTQKEVGLQSISVDLHDANLEANESLALA